MEVEEKMKLADLKKRIHKPNDLPMIIFSILLALVIWVLVAYSKYPDITKTVENIPVTVALQGSIAEQNELRIVEQSVEYINAEVKVARSAGNIQADNLAATISLDNISQSGNYTLDIQVTGKDGLAVEVLSLSKSQATVSLDRYITRTLEISPQARNIKAAEGYIRGELNCSPSAVDVTGPADQVNTITRCVVESSSQKDGLTDAYQIAATDVSFYNGATKISNRNLTLSHTNFTIDVPIYLQKTLTFELPFQALPSGFPLEELDYAIEPASIDVAASSALLESQEVFTLTDYADLRKISPDKNTMTIPVELPDEYINMNGVENVTVTFNMDGFSTKQLSLKSENVTISNQPAGYQISAQSKSPSNVTFVGRADIIEELSVEDVVIRLDMSQVSPNLYQDADLFSAPVSILIPNKGCVWALGNWTMAFQATAIGANS